MKIRKLELENYCGFANAELEFEDDLTVLVGVNGSGKSSVLLAVKMLIQDAVANLWKHEPSPVGWPTAALWSDRFMRFNSKFMTARCSFEWFGVASAQAINTKVIGGGMTQSKKRTVQPVDLRQLVNESLPFSQSLSHESSRTVDPSAVDWGGPGSPLCFYYPASRSTDVILSEAPQSENTPNYVTAMMRAFDNTMLRLDGFKEWFRAREDIENDIRANDGQPEHRDPVLESIRHAIRLFLQGFTAMRVDRKSNELTFTKDGLTLTDRMLSDGERSTLALVGDIARRLASVSNNANPSEVTAVILIDEIELHLHPKWQREVLARLQSVFAKCQFVVSTHSPQVLSMVDPRCIRLLIDGQITRTDAYTRGRDSNAILREVFDTPERPAAQQAEIQHIIELIECKSFGEARAKIAKLAEELSNQDQEVMRLQTELVFAEVDL